MDVSVIIVNWNSREDLKRCIASIRMHTRDIEYEIVVIDSGSNDGCDQMLRENYPDVRFVQSATNLGFARANNRAFEEATGENLLFLNPDTELTGPAITRLRSHLHSHPNAGIVGCRLLNSDGTVQSSCIQSIPTIWNQLLNSQFLRTRWPKSGLWGMSPLFQQGIAPREVEAISGACLMVRRHTFQQVNGFSEEYFMYAEDIDLAYKIRSAGYTNYYLPDATVIHHGGKSSHQAGSTFSAVMMPEAIWRFLRKTRGDAYASAYRAAMFASALGRLLLIGLSPSSWTGARPSTFKHGSVLKWRAVLRWAVSQDDIVKEHYRAAR